ncbi:MAG TPA: NAD-dependent epimerase/dehydratase family protein [Longimicrobiales bacterium]|nr:NAD-dependent epimerase/dehydratase family protein [Longimicrobiales bacterium]
MKVLVTGGAGFIGSHVADAYLAAGHDVWIVDDLTSGRRENVPADARFIELSIADAALEDVFRDAGGFDVVNHHAAQIDVRRSVSDPRFDAAVNIDGLLNVLERARTHGTGRVVFVSSGGVVYGEPETRPTPETAPKLPRSPYGVTKLAAEHYLYYYHTVHQLEYAALRYANVYGPRQDPHGEAGVVAIFSTRLLEERPLTVFGDGLQTRDYVFVGDVVAANLLLTGAELPPAAGLDERAFNVGTGVETSVLELADTLMEASGRRVPVEHAEARPGELRHSALDAARLCALGWTPGVSLTEGLGRTFTHIARERGVEVGA